MSEEKRKEAVEILNEIWISIDFSAMPNSRKINFWNEFTNKVKAAANSSMSFETFVEKLCKKLSISNLDTRCKIVAKVSRSDETYKKEFLKLYREQLTLIMLELRIKRDDEKEKYKQEQKAEKE